MSGGISATTIIAGVGAAASALGAISSLTKKSPSAAVAPALEAPKVMPTPDDDAARAAKRRAVAGLAQKRGRQSTILSDPLASGDLLGA